MKTKAQILICLIVILSFIASSLTALVYGNNARFTASNKFISIPFDLENNLIFLSVTINGSDPLSFILDTGSYSMLGTNQAKSLGLNLRLVGKTDGIGDDQQNVYLVTNKIVYGPSTALLTNQRLLAVPLGQVEDCFNKAIVNEQGQDASQTQNIRSRSRRPVDGILGKEFFNSFVVEIDYDSRIIRAHDPVTYKYDGKGERLNLEVAPQHVFVRAKITAGRSSIEGRFLADTGYATAVSLTKQFVDRNKLLPPIEQLTNVPVCGLGGMVKGQSLEGYLESLELGSVKIEKPLTEFSQAQVHRDYDGYIGSAVFRRFKVIFDYSRKVMILEPRHKRKE